MFVFDHAVSGRGSTCAGVPLTERKRLLKEVLVTSDLIRYSEHFEGHGAELLEAAKQQGIEGVIGKRASSFYESRRGADWVKFKVTESDSFVLCGLIKGEQASCSGRWCWGSYDTAGSSCGRATSAHGVRSQDDADDSR